METNRRSHVLEARRREPGDLSPVNPSLRDGLAAHSAPRGFTLTELLVAVAIVLVLMAIVGSAVSSARGSQKTTATRSLISTLSQAINTQLARYDSYSAVGSDPLRIMTTAGFRSWSIRRNQITGDLVDRWTDVAYMVAQSGTAGEFPLASISGAQRAYIAAWNAAASAQYAGAECLFMVVMQSGLFDRTTIESLRNASIGDKDQDGMPEFLDGWGNPVEFILWPAGFEVPSRRGQRFFTGDRALVPAFKGEDDNVNGLLDAGEDLNGNGFLDAPSPTLGMVPLIYSAGPDGEYCLDRGDEVSQLQMNITGTAPVGRDCGNWQFAPASLMGRPLDGSGRHVDNITNLDAEARQ